VPAEYLIVYWVAQFLGAIGACHDVTTANPDPTDAETS
jgi:hypothetical protein